MSATAKQPKEKKALPDGWRWAKLGDVCKVVGGSTPDTGNSAYWDGDIFWVTPTDLGKLSNIIISTTTRQITSHGLQSCSAEIVPIGTVIMSSRAPIGHLAIAGVSLCTNQGCKSFVPGFYIDSVFLYWTLKQAVPSIQALGSGATFTEVSKSALQQFAIPLPPLHEQRRIAGVLKEQMVAVDKARAAAQTRLEAVKTLPAAFLRQVFPQPGQPLPDDWRWVKLGEVCDVVNGYGFSESLQGRSNLPYPFIKVSDMNAAGAESVVSTAVNTVDDSILHALGARTYPAGTVIFPKVGGALLTNKKRILGCEATFDNNVMGVVPQHVESEWIFYWTQTIDLAAMANTQALPSIRQRAVAALLLPLPSIPEQVHIITILKKQMAAVDKARAAAETELQTINALPVALLRRAFSGEL